jgi:hypothetical protein
MKLRRLKNDIHDGECGSALGGEEPAAGHRHWEMRPACAEAGKGRNDKEAKGGAGGRARRREPQVGARLPVLSRSGPPPPPRPLCRLDPACLRAPVRRWRGRKGRIEQNESPRVWRPFCAARTASSPSRAVSVSNSPCVPPGPCQRVKRSTGPSAQPPWRTSRLCTSACGAEARALPPLGYATCRHGKTSGLPWSAEEKATTFIF